MKLQNRDSPWIKQPLKPLIKKKERLYRNYKPHVFRDGDKIGLENFRKKCKEAVEKAKTARIR